MFALMCGIAGFLNYQLPEGFSQKVHQIQGHRGPDAQRSVQYDGALFCHQRLSIIDLDTRSDQPMEKDGLTIIFNGEIYNYKSLREELLSNYGVAFKTTSDTEAVLELYRHLGKGALDKLHGMFAFAIYEHQTREVFLARDHFGIKPLFYTSEAGKFAFASELKTLTALPGFDRSLHYPSLVGSMNFVWAPGNDTMFKNVHKLPPGHYMNVQKDGQFDIGRYYDPENKIRDISENEALEQLDAIMDESVGRHMVSDVPVSAFLSGGLDSSLLCALAAKRTERLSTYAIATHPDDRKIEKMPDDAKYAKEVAQKFNLDHHEVLVRPDIVNHLPFIVRALDEPIGDPAAINTWLICKQAAEQGVKVLLSGMGADELFFGYRRQKAILFAMRYRNFPAGAKKLIRMGVDQLPLMVGQQGFKLGRWSKRFMDFSDLPAPEAYLRSYSYYDQDTLKGMFTHDMSMEVEDMAAAHTARFNSAYEGDLINQMCNTDISYFMNGLNLTYTDRASMAASVEVRVPFIDKDVVNFAMGLPGNLKFRNGTSKYLLRKMSEKYLPEKITARPKASFGAPIRSWVLNDLDEMIGDLLAPETIKRRGLLVPEQVERLISENKSGKADNAYQIYHLLTLELWMREFVDG